MNIYEIINSDIKNNNFDTTIMDENCIQVDGKKYPITHTVDSTFTPKIVVNVDGYEISTSISMEQLQDLQVYGIDTGAEIKRYLEEEIRNHQKRNPPIY